MDYDLYISVADRYINLFQVENVNNQIEQIKREYEKKLDHFARLLDARSIKIQVNC